MNKHESRVASGSLGVFLLSLILAGVAVLMYAPIVLGTMLGGIVFIYLLGYVLNDVLLEA